MKRIASEKTGKGKYSEEIISEDENEDESQPEKPSGSNEEYKDDESRRKM